MTPGTSGAPGSGTIKQIGMIPRFPPDYGYTVVPHDVNGNGEVVGGIYDSQAFLSYYAFAWVDGGGTVDLNDLVDPNSGWILSDAFAINNNREVVGRGYFNGQERAFKMTLPDLSPCPPVDSCHAPALRNPRKRKVSRPSGACGRSLMQQPQCMHVQWYLPSRFLRRRLNRCRVCGATQPGRRHHAQRAAGCHLLVQQHRQPEHAHSIWPAELLDAAWQLSADSGSHRRRRPGSRRASIGGHSRAR